MNSTLNDILVISTSQILLPYLNVEVDNPRQSAKIREQLGSNQTVIVTELSVLDGTKNKLDSVEKVNGTTKYGCIAKGLSSIIMRRNYNGISELREVHRYVGVQRIRIKEYSKYVPDKIASVEVLDDSLNYDQAMQVKNSEDYKKFQQLSKILISNYLDSNRAEQFFNLIEKEMDVNKMMFILFGIIKTSNLEKILFLQLNKPEERLKFLLPLFVNETKNKKELPPTRTDNYQIMDSGVNLNSRMKFQGGDKADNELEEKFTAKKSKMPDYAVKVVEKELNRYKSMRNSSLEGNVIRNYLDCILDLPWNEGTTDCNELKKAEFILNRDHSGLEKVKTRILEYLAVRALKGNSKGTIICFLGPPGVGKTSLGKSIAEALGRKFERLSLGGIRDEADIRGHRRTYVGAMPGNLISCLKRCQSNNPVILLDEIDKLSKSFQGDPASALLEVLDPAQNHTFKDHFLDMPFDLSNTFFIATANKLDSIPGPLLDRLEVINISGYTKKEKLEIAETYLVPRQTEENGLSKEIIRFDRPSIELIISGYTKESGVRELERNIGAVCRKVAVEYSNYKQDHKTEPAEFSCRTVTTDKVKEVLGMLRFEDDLRDRIIYPGVSTGMAWTETGGKVLYIETSLSPGQGQIQITGQLGEVMKESIYTALGWIRSNVKILNLSEHEYRAIQVLEDTSDEKSRKLRRNIFSLFDLHVHFPAAAVPKDGPSAGVAITTALVSLLSWRKVRSDTAMTGEVTLKGLVMPVGGIKEKCLAAHAAGIKRIILPWRNRKDVEEISAEVKSEIQFFFAKTVEEVIELALERERHTGENYLNLFRAEAEKMITMTKL